jgi:uncharacterized membrane protein YcaP (DUF421 family)
MDIVIRSALVFLALFFVIRVTGKRQIAELSAFDLILLVTMGDLIGQTVLQEDYSLTAGLLAVSTFGILTVAFSWLAYFVPRARPVLEGEPTVIVRDGAFLRDTARHELIPYDDLLEAARSKGIRNIDEVELAVLEANGSISFFTRQADSDDEPAEGG